MFKEKFSNIDFSFEPVVLKVKEIWYTPKARSQAIACFVLILLSLLPIILSAIVFAVSHPTAAARTAIYLVTFAFALVASGYTIYVFRKRIIAILAKESTGNFVMKDRQKQKHKKQQPDLPTHYVSNAVDAFSSEQREYNRRHGDQGFVSPTLASNSTGHYLMPNPQVPEYLPYEPLQMPDPEAHTNAAGGNTTAANDLYLVPMPQPRTQPLQVRNLIESDDSIGKKATPPEMSMPTPPPPSYSGTAPKMPLPPIAGNKGLDGSPDMPPLPRLHVLTPQAPTRPKSTLNLPPLPAGSSPTATGSADSKGATQHQDEITFDSEEDSDDDSDDGGSVKLYSFDKVKVRSDSPLDQQLFGSQSRMTIMSSVESVPAFASQQSQNIKSQAPNSDASASASTSNINLSQIKQASDSATRAADGDSQQDSSFSDLPSQPETMSSGTKPVLEKFPEAPKSKLRLSIFPENSSEAGLVEKWLQTGTQPVPPNPATRQINKKSSIPAVPSPLSSSIADLVIPDKFVSAEGSKIVKSPTKPSSQEQEQVQVMSIYGERDALANIRDSEVSQYDLPGQVSYVNSVVDFGPVPTIPKRPDLNVSRADPDDLAKIDEPLLESSDLSLRRPTLVDFQKKADAKRKLMGDLEQNTSQDSERSIGGNLNDDSRYFSAVSLPQTQNQNTAPSGNFMDIAEEDEDSDDEHEEEAFLDSDSDDEAIESHPQSANDATAIHFTGSSSSNNNNNSANTPASSAAVAAATAFAQATNESTEWRPASVSMDSLAAQLAKAITHGDKPHDSLVSNHEAGLRDSLLIKSQTPAASPHAGLQPPSPSRLPANILSRGLRDSQFDEPRAAPRPSDSSIFLDGEDYGADLVMTSVARNTQPETQK